jgi:hypothetical protein
VRALIAPQASPDHNGGLVSRAIITQPVAAYHHFYLLFIYLTSSSISPFDTPDGNYMSQWRISFHLSHHPTLRMATTCRSAHFFSSISPSDTPDGNYMSQCAFLFKKKWMIKQAASAKSESSGGGVGGAHQCIGRKHSHGPLSFAIALDRDCP